MRHTNAGRAVFVSDPLFSIRFAPDLSQEELQNQHLLRSVPFGLTVLGGRNADDVNDVVVAGGYEPVYAEGSLVIDLIVEQKVRFVRLYKEDESWSHRVGVWLLNARDLEGLSPQQIADKFNLNSAPNMIADVAVPARTKIRMGFAPSLPAYTRWGAQGPIGGGIQFTLDIPRHRVPDRWFSSGRDFMNSHIPSRRF